MIYSLALFRVELQEAKRRLLRVFDMVDETSTARTPSAEIANARESGLTGVETSLDVCRPSTASIPRKRWRVESEEQHA
jgi:hypothetical protein